MDRIAPPISNRASGSPGARLLDDGVEFSVFSRHGDAVFVCLFDSAGERETERWRLGGRDDDIHHGFIPGLQAGAVGQRRGQVFGDSSYNYDVAHVIVSPPGAAGSSANRCLWRNSRR